MFSFKRKFNVSMSCVNVIIKKHSLVIVVENTKYIVNVSAIKLGFSVVVVVKPVAFV